MNNPLSQRPASRRGALQLGLGAALAGALGPSAFAQGAWPNRPLTFVVGFPPGGQTDFAGRAVMAPMQALFGQPVVIDNRAGANGNIATDFVAKSPPDGYRMLVGNGINMTLNQHTYRNVVVTDPRKLTPVGVLLKSSMMLVVPATLPVKSMQELAAWLKLPERGPRGADYASSGAGSVTQAMMELFRGEIGKPPMVHIPYKGSGPAMTDLIAGRTVAMFDGASVVAPFIRSGQLRALMVTGDQRIPAFPDVPTAVELGLKDFKVTAFIGLYGPLGMDAATVARINEVMNTALKDPGVQKTITERGDEPGGGSPEELGRLTAHYHKVWGEVVAANPDIRVD